MNDDYGKAAAAPSRITLGGVDYRVAKQGPRIYGELTQFLKSFVPDPRLKAKELLAAIPPDAVALKDVALRIWEDLSREAENWPPSLESFEGNQILTTTHEGATQVVYSLLRRHNADITLERARSIADDITAAEIAEMIRLSMPEPTFDPKSPAGTTTDRGPVPA